MTARSDIFALGLVIYELFTGRRAFTATTIGELVSQHENRSLARPSAIVTALDPAIERAILACLEPDPDRRPASALAVSAALPGGDPLAAALAAGETPSPEMVAAAGEGAGLSARVAWPVLLALVAGIAASFAMASANEPARQDAARVHRGSPRAESARRRPSARCRRARPRDEAFGFRWNEELVEHVQETDKPAPRWDTVLHATPLPARVLVSTEPRALTGSMFHTDLLTPGIVGPDDPPPITSGMSTVELDHRGRLTLLRNDPGATTGLADPCGGRRLGAAVRARRAGPRKLTPAEPLWNWLAGIGHSRRVDRHVAGKRTAPSGRGRGARRAARSRSWRRDRGGSHGGCRSLRRVTRT